MKGRASRHAHLLLPGLAVVVSGMMPGAASAAAAVSAPEARLVSCGKESCLLVSGQRNDAAAQVRINGHRVVVDGRRGWRVRLPIETVRAWSPPMARTIEVTIGDRDLQDGAVMQADLPVGLLGRMTDLSALVVASG